MQIEKHIKSSRAVTNSVALLGSEAQWCSIRSSDRNATAGDWLGRDMLLKR
jgi:hypothetical protein